MVFDNRNIKNPSGFVSPMSHRESKGFHGRSRVLLSSLLGTPLHSSTSVLCVDPLGRWMGRIFSAQ